ncbi:tripartite motif containing 13-like [Dendronephthya gigantea]|uniref:tripartite motif containing 13-like n=1 Tax=Dendronephthya gigantea TaxID=151771 RepID=UPI00106B172D|nr:tripartite motif containing 13-like [Dendronephthya gigantea]
MAEKPSSPVSDLAELVTCSICLGPFRDARALPCVHSYCKECLQGLVTPQAKLTCPHCREDFEVPDGDVSNLNRNFQLNEIVDVFNSMTCAVPNDEGLSENSPTDATQACLANQTTCKDHTGKECELFCQNCFKLICFECISKWGTCTQHLYESIDVVAKEFRENIKEFVRKKEEQLPSVIKHGVVLEDMREKQSLNSASVTNEILETFGKQIENLEKRRDALTNQVVDMQLKNDDCVASEVDRVRIEQAKIENTIEFCNKIIDVNDSALFLQKYIQVKMFLTEPQELVSHVDVRALLFQATDSLMNDVISNFGNVVLCDESSAAEEEKLVREERPTSKHAGHATSTSPIPANEPGPSNKLHRNYSTASPRPVVPNAPGEQVGIEKPVVAKLYIKNLARMNNPFVTFEDNGFGVKTKSSKNEAIIGNPGFRMGKHSWKIKVVGCPDGLSIGICVGFKGRGKVVTYDSALTSTSTETNVLVELDCSARKLSVSPDGYQPDTIGFDNPHNYEVHPYFLLPPSNIVSCSKITIVSIDGHLTECVESCCIL